MKTATAFFIVVTILMIGVIVGLLCVNIEVGIFLATAIGSISYVLFTYWDQHVASPKLQILFDPSKPDEYTPQLEIFVQNFNALGTFRFVRVIVQNLGSRPATGCVAQIKLLERLDGCTMFSEEPKTLRWTDIPEGDYIPPHGGRAVLGIAFAPRELNITTRDRRCAFQNTETIVVKALAHTPEALANPFIRAQDSFCTGNFKIRLTVYCKETDPIPKDFILHVDDNWQNLSMKPVEG